MPAKAGNQWPIIILLGQTGCGKSTFINAADPKLATKPQVGHGLESCTKYPEAYGVENPTVPNQYVILIDTPGFNDSDSTIGDKEQLDTIASWLKKHYLYTNLRGIIYLHAIKDQPQQSLSLVTPRQLPSPPSISFVTTQWCNHGPTDQFPTYERNESSLKNYAPQHVQPLRFFDTVESAWEIIHGLCESSSGMEMETFTNMLNGIGTDLVKPKKGFKNKMYARLIHAIHRL